MSSRATPHQLVTPAKAGAQLSPLRFPEINHHGESWVPAFAGMTDLASHGGSCE
jgi:hypothetical protein